MVIISEIVTHEMSQKVLQVMIIIYIVRVHTQNEAVCFACQSIFNVNLICWAKGYGYLYQLTRKTNHFVLCGGPQ
jgi:hypothetical protein